MNNFEGRYQLLNAAQKQAVDTMYGPVMVVAGPGTGKTELLSMRVANILKKSDALASNILCLTFTESGASAMRERLVSLIGPEAYKVAIHTFHSFGSEIIAQHGEYFYNGAHFRPADELSSYEVLTKLLDKLPHDNVLASKMNDQFTYLRDLQTAISDLKKSGLTPDELLQILDRNDAFVEWVQPRLAVAFSDRLSKKSFPAIELLLKECNDYHEDTLELINYEPLYTLFCASLETALAESTNENSTKPLSAWKKSWCEKREDGEITLCDAKRCLKLRTVAGVYYDYLIAMQERSLYDFDDMILRVVHATEVFNDLRLNLQEQYQFILIDEFQDTNDAQMRLVWNLTNNPAMEGKPNLLIVGDDDQAIYRFQGANLSNILEFRNLYTDVQLVTLTDNYRSTREILSTAREVITQAEERLETVIESIDKTLTPRSSTKDSAVVLTSYEDDALEFAALAEQLAEDVAKHPTRTRAIIARHHKQLLALLPYLNAKKLPLRYDRQENVLKSEPVQLLELTARVVMAFAQHRFADANGLLPELLAHPAWRISARELWELSLRASREQLYWLEVMLGSEGRIKDIAEWLVVCSHYAQYEPLEFMLDHLMGSLEQQAADDTSSEPSEVEGGEVESTFISPLRDYFFSSNHMDAHPAKYLAYLQALRTIRRSLREYRPDQALKLADFVEFLDMHREMSLSIQAQTMISADLHPIELLTAHKAKGLEYDDVYVVSLNDNIWGETARGRGRLINFPHNLPLAISGDTSDERIRLLYVALTRAKEYMYLSHHARAENGRESLLAAYLTLPSLSSQEAKVLTPVERVKAESLSWQTPLLSIPRDTMREVLAPNLERYHLSPTHLNNFLDISRGGPQLFLLQNLLRFPQAMSPAAAYGSAIHATLQRAHQHLRANGKRRPIEDILGDYETELRRHQLSEDNCDHFIKRGTDTLNAFLTARYDSFHLGQIAEQNFSTEHIVLNDARLTGAIDLMDVDDESKTIIVTDYKTGRPVRSWAGKTEYEKIKLHHYRQQLLFYKLLIEGSRQFQGYTVTTGIIEFVEPTATGEITRLELTYETEELAHLTQLISAVWQRIQSLDFELPEEYPATLKGILAFEDTLLSN